MSHTSKRVYRLSLQFRKENSFLKTKASKSVPIFLSLKYIIIEFTSNQQTVKEKLPFIFSLELFIVVNTQNCAYISVKVAQNFVNNFEIGVLN